MILQRLKAFGLVFLLGIILSGGVGTYVYFKLKGETEAKFSQMESQLEHYQETVAVMSDSFVRREELGKELRAKRGEVRREVTDAKKTSQDVRDYLDTGVPDRLQLVLERARCLQVPGDCVHGNKKAPETRSNE